MKSGDLAIVNVTVALGGWDNPCSWQGLVTEGDIVVIIVNFFNDFQVDNLVVTCDRRIGWVVDGHMCKC